jgi:DNA-binding MarR family transcriptional regulator
MGDHAAVQPAREVQSAQLTPEQLTAWRLFLRAHARILRRLEADLLREHHLPLASYDVLVQLVEAPERRLRMTELADRVLLSRSGLTRLVDRLEREGVVVREACAEDARGMFAVLTDAGYERLRAAAPTHLRGVQEYAVGRLSGDELTVLGRLLARLADEPADERAAASAGSPAHGGQCAAPGD